MPDIDDTWHTFPITFGHEPAADEVADALAAVDVTHPELRGQYRYAAVQPHGEGQGDILWFFVRRLDALPIEQ